MQNRADKRKYHYIYKIIRDDGCYYLGMHSTDDLDDGYFGSGTLILDHVGSTTLLKSEAHAL